jgi:hypothetical protein
MIDKLNQNKNYDLNSHPKQDNDLMNYEQKSTSSDQGHGYQEKPKLVINN